MKLSIILTVYNKAPYLHRAFDALLNQEGAEEDEYEVLVVNDKVKFVHLLLFIAKSFKSKFNLLFSASFQTLFEFSFVLYGKKYLYYLSSICKFEC